MSYPGWMIEPSVIGPEMLVVRQPAGAADILLLSSAPARSGVFFAPVMVTQVPAGTRCRGFWKDGMTVRAGVAIIHVLFGGDIK